MQQPKKRSHAGSARATLALRLVTAILAFMLLPAFAAGPAGGGAPIRNPRLASLKIEIWPEYDRPAALVILRGALAANTKLPANVTLRLAAASGGPSAIAYSATDDGDLLNLEYEQNVAKEFITLRFKAPGRYFHIEFYDPLATATPVRDYTYVWPGDFAVERLSVVVQEPAAASEFSTQPGLDAAAPGQDGLRYRSAELGAQSAGKPLPIKVRYAKTDARTSAEILQPKTAPALVPAPAATPQAIEGPSKKELALWLVALVATLVLGGIGASAWWYRRKSVSESQGGGGRFCTQCGSPSASGDRFCSKCGAPLK